MKFSHTYTTYIQYTYTTIYIHNFNNSLFSKVSPNSLKKADITPIFKKDEKFLKNNYRPVSILPNASKIYEHCIYDQINDYFHPLFSKLQCRFQKGFNAQHCLLVLIEKCHEVLDKRGYAGVLLIDLSKGFACINHELLLTKLQAYGFSLDHLFKAIYLTESKGLKSTLQSVNIVILNQECHKAQHLDLSFLIFSFVICSLMISI